jgi:hypothetical protein
MKNTTDKKSLIPLSFDLNDMHFEGYALPISQSCREDVCFELNIHLNGEDLGTISCRNDLKWTMEKISDHNLIEKIGELILLWYE